MSTEQETDYDDDEPTCVRCSGSGEIITCPDDMCRGSDECMHGDGMDTCPDCKGKGWTGLNDQPTVG